MKLKKVTFILQYSVMPSQNAQYAFTMIVIGTEVEKLQFFGTDSIVSIGCTWLQEAFIFGWIRRAEAEFCAEFKTATFITDFTANLK